ncbi:hypothetical protein BpHYR1_015575 [Brachionus plicatilis]|uniref:Uncharacterized protein n=1 Tax=Brachionus plicatilis TaxID=10195 RepID=A0A3M7S515_BRAPC|nr:hypothetical protein BpHYR1_015575 [Brachionus plicatilis]
MNKHNHLVQLMSEILNINGYKFLLVGSCDRGKKLCLFRIDVTILLHVAHVCIVQVSGKLEEIER